MAKYGNEFYLQLPRVIFREPYCNMSTNAFRLFCTLKELEARYADSEGYFFRTNEELCQEVHVSMVTLKKAKAELKKLNLITVGKTRWVNNVTHKKSERYVSCYRIVV